MASNKSSDRVLRKRSDFNNLKLRGTRNSPARWVTLYSVPNTDGYLRFAFTLSRKVGTAVVRNRLRRWGREVFRELLKEEQLEMGVDINVVFRPMGTEFYVELSRDQFRKSLFKGWQMVLKNRAVDSSSSY